jgi:hypothetical protein
MVLLVLMVLTEILHMKLQLQMVLKEQSQRG